MQHTARFDVSFVGDLSITMRHPEAMRGKAPLTLLIEQHILDIVEKRFPIGVRGVAYALSVRKLIDSMAVKYTKRVSEIMTDLRERELLDWRKIVDGSREVDLPPTYRNADTIITLAVETYRRDYWQHQPVIIEVWSEKATVRGLLRPVLHEYGVEFRNVRGFGSFTALCAGEAGHPPDARPELRGLHETRRPAQQVARN